MKALMDTCVFVSAKNKCWLAMMILAVGITSVSTKGFARIIESEVEFIEQMQIHDLVRNEGFDRLKKEENVLNLILEQGEKISAEPIDEQSEFGLKKGTLMNSRLGYVTANLRTNLKSVLRSFYKPSPEGVLVKDYRRVELKCRYNGNWECVLITETSRISGFEDCGSDTDAYEFYKYKIYPFIIKQDSTGEYTQILNQTSYYSTIEFKEEIPPYEIPQELHEKHIKECGKAFYK